MIITKLRGGLGNQLFQYATGYRLAQVAGCPLMFDLSFYQDTQSQEGARAFALDKYKIDAAVATPKDVSRVLYGSWRRRLQASLLSVRENRCNLLSEGDFRFDPSILAASGHVYLDGYWQSEKYFVDVRRQLLRNLTLRYEPSLVTRSFANKIKPSRAISVHFRRGDYVSDTEAASIHGICSMDYYENAMARMLEIVEDPVFFVFSDDLDWVRWKFSTPFPMVFVEGNEESPQEDLMLMSLCRYHIIANSTFSWWGAWLADFPDKVVISPRKWFLDEKIDTSDLIPEGWVRL